jgi:archaellum component FlaF (FlaF/FlaG flagellin family)
MAQIETPIKLNVSDFPPEQQQTVERLADVYNFFVDNVANVVNGNLSYDNYNVKVVTLQVSVDSAGKPSQAVRFSSNTGAIGSRVINAKNLSNGAIYPTSQPFISFSASGTGIYTINHVTGLPVGNKFELTIEMCFP